MAKTIRLTGKQLRQLINEARGTKYRGHGWKRHDDPHDQVSPVEFPDPTGDFRAEDEVEAPRGADMRASTTGCLACDHMGREFGWDPVNPDYPLYPCDECLD
jgi:hypothetical protein